MAINRYTKPVEQTLEKYVPLPFQEMQQAASMIQQRGDLAQQQVDQTQIGLASIAANPYHQDFVNTYANEFKTKATELLDKYQGNTSNPEFVRESKRLGMQFASDPRLKAVQQAKLEYDKKQAAKQELDAKGIKYVDTNPTYNGLDTNGQISGNVGTLKSTDYDKIISDRIQQAASKMEQRGSLRSNQWNIAGTAQSLKKQIFTDPELSLGVQHLMQQGGMNQEQAVRTMSEYIDNVSNSMISSDIDHHDSDRAWDRFKYFDTRAREQARQAQEQPPSNPNLFPFVRDEGQVTPLSFNKDKLTKISNILNNVNENGGLKRSNVQLIADTPQNRVKYAGKFDEKPIYGKSGGTGGAPPIIGKQLRIREEYSKNSYNADELSVLREARKFLGNQAKNEKGQYLSDKRVLETYKQILEKDDVALSHIRPNNAEYNKSLSAVRVGDKGQFLGNNWALVGRDGEIKQSSSKSTKEALKDLSGFEFAGINSQPFGKYTNGTIKINAVDKDNNTVQIYKPLSRDEKMLFELPNKVNQLIQSGAIEGIVQDINGVEYAVRNTASGIEVFRKTQQGFVPVDFSKLVDDRFNAFYNYQQPYQDIK